MTTLASFLKSKDFFLPGDDDGYWPDAHYVHHGIKYGTANPNDGALTVEILVGGRWHVRMMGEGDEEWDYKMESVIDYACAIIDEWLAIREQ